ncbi:MAG: cobalamin biosynthesis protein [Alphaproteobacteria bacterium]|nr:cobalamin biosynthesis protein [Alphaproteobacteria bacterium]
MITLGWASPATIDPLLLLLVALAVDAYVGEMSFLFRVVPHPVVAMGRAIDWLERRLNRAERGAAALRIRGALSIAALCLAGIVIGTPLVWFSRHYPMGWLVELFLLITLVAQRSLYDHVNLVYRTLRDEGLYAGRQAVSRIVGRDPAALDEHGVARAAIESCAENFSDGVVAPVFWYVLFGLPGLLVYKIVNTADSMIGHPSPRYADFGKAAARLDDAMNLIPARLSGVLLAIAACFAPTANPAGAFATMWRDAGKHRSPNAGWPEAAMAGALGVALAGPRRYAERTVEDPWIGNGRARALPEDIRRALVVFGIACLVHWALIAALLVLRLRA